MCRRYEIVLLFFLSFGIRYSSYSQGVSKVIFVDTGIKKLKEKDVSIFHKREEMDMDFKAYSVDLEPENGNVYFRIDANDTTVFCIKGYIPIIIQGLGKIRSDTITITKIPLDKYVAVDTIRFSSIDYYMQDTVMHVTKRRNGVITPNNSKKFNPKHIDITINKIKHEGTIQSEPNEQRSIACNPGSYSSTKYIVGINKYYVFDL